MKVEYYVTQVSLLKTKGDNLDPKVIFVFIHCLLQNMKSCWSFLQRKSLTHQTAAHTFCVQHFPTSSPHPGGGGCTYLTPPRGHGKEEWWVNLQVIVEDTW